MSGFVDDTRIFVTTTRSEGRVMELCNMLQDSAQSWEYLLTTSSGKLNPGKCDEYIVRWNFREDRTPTLNNTYHYKIPITSSIDGTISYIKYLYPSKSILYLRHSSQPDGNQQTSFNILINNAKTFARRVILTSMSR